jgi:signal recognition particle subunit SRP54
MLVGLQGSGKTTAAAKLARLLRSQGERVMLAARLTPTGRRLFNNLSLLGEKVDVPVFYETCLKPPESGKKGV